MQIANAVKTPRSISFEPKLQQSDTFECSGCALHLSHPSIDLALSYLCNLLILAKRFNLGTASNQNPYLKTHYTFQKQDL